MLFYTSVVSNPIIYSLSLSKFREMLTKDMHKYSRNYYLTFKESERAALSNFGTFCICTPSWGVSLCELTYSIVPGTNNLFK